MMIGICSSPAAATDVFVLATAASSFQMLSVSQSIEKPAFEPDIAELLSLQVAYINGKENTWMYVALRTERTI